MKKRGLKFGEKHTGVDWGLILTSKSCPLPEPKTNYISVDGRDGDIDITEALTGEIKYENRKHSYTFFTSNGTCSSRDNLYREIYRTLHGKKIEIIEDDDSNYYLEGRCTVTLNNRSNSYMELTIEVNCEPYKKRILDTVRSIVVDGTEKELTCANDGFKKIIPTLIVAGLVTIKFNTLSISLSDGTHKVTDFKLDIGINVLTVGGNGTLKVVYNEVIL